MQNENKLDLVALTFYIIMLTILGLFCIWGTMVKIAERRERRSRDLHSQTGTVTKIVLNRFPTRDFEMQSLSLDLRESDRCVICYQEYLVGEVVRELPCDHFFHKKVSIKNDKSVSILG
jgi:hypothetical protein